MAGANGNSNARVFCRRIEAELVAINGFYCTADLIDPTLRAVRFKLGWMVAK